MFEERKGIDTCLLETEEMKLIRRKGESLLVVAGLFAAYISM